MSNSNLKDKLMHLEMGFGVNGLPSLSPTMKLMSITNDALKKLEKFYGLYRLGKDEEYTAVHGTVAYLNFYDAKKTAIKDQDGNETYSVKFYPIALNPYLPKGAEIDTAGCSVNNPEGKKIEVVDFFHYRKYMDLYNAFVEFSINISKNDFRMNTQMTEAGYIMTNQVWQLPDHVLESVKASVKAERDEVSEVSECLDGPIDCREVRSSKRKILCEDSRL